MTALQRIMVATVLLGLTLAPLSALARPIAVTLYPNSGEVTERATVELVTESGQTKTTLTLPAAADPATLRIFPDAKSGLTPADISIQSIERRDEGRIKMVQGQLNQAKAKRQELMDKRAAHEGAAAYWRSISGKEGPKASDAAGMATAVRQGLIVELAAASALSRDIKAQAKTIKKLEAELKRLTGGSVRILVATVTLTGKSAKQAELQWSYRLNAAGWTPRYTLNAKPDTAEIDFTWNAELWQNTGTVWNDVAITLATAEFRGGHTPGKLPPWHIRPDAPLLRKAEAMFNDGAMLKTKTMTAGGKPAPASAKAPVRRKGRVFDSYDAGRTSLESGDRKRILMERKSWKAQFDYLVRPAVGPGAFTRAVLEFKNAPKYPKGQATYLLDSAMVRKASFALYAKKSDLFFGTDPQLKISLLPLSRQSGKAGFLSSKKSHSWDWRISINNTKSIPVPLRIEERIPQIGDERIELEKRLPNAEEENGGLAVWELTLSPGEKSDLEYGYTITYPKDMHLDLGGR